MAFVQSRINADADAVNVHSTLDTETASHVYVKQTKNGIPISNAVANVAFNKDNKVVAFGSTFIDSANVASSDPTVAATDAIATAEKQLNATFDQENFPEPTLEYLVQQDGSLALTHVVQVRNEAEGTWVEAFVDAHSGDIVSITDFVAKASVSTSLSTCVCQHRLILMLLTVPRPSYSQGTPH